MKWSDALKITTWIVELQQNRKTKTKFQCVRKTWWRCEKLFWKSSGLDHPPASSFHCCVPLNTRLKHGNFIRTLLTDILNIRAFKTMSHSRHRFGISVQITNEWNISTTFEPHRIILSPSMHLFTLWLVHAKCHFAPSGDIVDSLLLESHAVTRIILMIQLLFLHASINPEPKSKQDSNERINCREVN